VAFAGALAWMLREWIADMRITVDDRNWNADIGSYIRNQDEHLPAIDRFNIGQKYFFWVMLWAGAVLLVTGVVLWFAERMPADVLRISILLHVGAAITTVGAFTIHVYMGTAVVRGGFTSIIRGEVSHGWARTHHRLWYHRVTGR
jgi:formate dehydrogenase subunit gamma